MKRKADIAALLAKAAQQLSQILKEYDSSLQQQAIAAPLLVDIKNYCENLRSVLDYLAHEIREKYCPGANPKDRFYFPIFPDATQLATQAGKWFPGLATSAATVWAALENCQPYQPGCAWLASFNKVNNENKHGALVPQTRQEVGTQVKAEILWLRAAGAGRQFAPAALVRRFWAPLNFTVRHRERDKRHRSVPLPRHVGL